MKCVLLPATVFVLGFSTAIAANPMSQKLLSVAREVEERLAKGRGGERLATITVTGISSNIDFFASLNDELFEYWVSEEGPDYVVTIFESKRLVWTITLISDQQLSSSNEVEGCVRQRFEIVSGKQRVTFYLTDSGEVFHGGVRFKSDRPDWYRDLWRLFECDVLRCEDE